jgi:hypothetical protein
VGTSNRHALDSSKERLKVVVDVEFADQVLRELGRPAEPAEAAFSHMIFNEGVSEKGVVKAR